MGVLISFFQPLLHPSALLLLLFQANSQCHGQTTSFRVTQHVGYRRITLQLNYCAKILQVWGHPAILLCNILHSVHSVRTGLQGKYQKELFCSTVMLRTYCERLLFHAGSETNPTKYPSVFSVPSDEHWVRVFLKWHKAGLANMRPSRKVFSALGHLNSLSNTA